MHRATGNEFLKVVYVNQLLVLSPQFDNGSSVRPTLWVNITPGEQTTLVQEGPGLKFNRPVKQIGRPITVENKTGVIVDFAIGFVDEERRPTPLVMFPDIGDKSSISTEFFPVLQASITSGYAEGDAPEGATEETNASPFWTQDLRLLRDQSDWTFERDPISGRYGFTCDSSKIEKEDSEHLETNYYISEKLDDAISFPLGDPLDPLDHAKDASI